MSNTIQLYWWRPTRPLKSLASEMVSHPGAWARLAASGDGVRNFGDEVGRDIVQELSHRKVAWSPIERADVASVGSILNSVLRRGSAPLIFGSGLREPFDLTAAVELLPEFISVRGELTRAALGLPADLPLSDPGIITSELYPAPRTSVRRHPVFIPHFAMLGTRSGRTVVAQFRAEGWRIALPNLAPREMAETISRASRVVTTSLHAIVFAHSYGVPVAKLALPGHPGEPEFKYQDYSSVLNVSIPEFNLQSSLSGHSGLVADDLAQTTAEISARLPALIQSVYSAGRSLS